MRGASRRKFLQAAASVCGLGAVGTWHFGTVEALDAQTAASSVDYPDNVADPLISVTSTDWALIGPVDFADMGWEDADPELAAREILRLDPDLVAEFGLQGFEGPPAKVGFWDRHEAVRDFAHGHRLPFQLGVSYHFRPEDWFDNWYRGLPDEDKWRRPDGSIVEHPRELTKRNYEDEVPLDEAVVEGLRDSIVPSLFAGGTVDRLARCGHDVFEFGANHYFVDLFVSGIVDGLDFSEWAQAAFREHLRSLPSDRLAELGVDDPAGLDVRDLFSDRGIAPADIDSPAEDPVFREYNLLQHRRQKEVAKEAFEGARADIPADLLDAGTSVHGEGFWLQWQRLNPANIYTSDHLDVVHLNLNVSTVPPDRPHDVTVKLGRAVGRFEKPVAVAGRLNSVHGDLFGMDPTRYYPTLLQFEIAQAFAHGGRRRIPITSWDAVPYDTTIQKAMRPDGTIDESIHRLVDFIQAHRRFLDGFTEANDTVVVVSLPTAMYRAPNWGRWRTGHELPIGEAATVLRREHIPYDVLVLDYPPLWDAPEQTEKLAKYDRIILPGVECVSDRHVAGIEAALDAGATVIATAGAPTRDEEYQPRDDLEVLLDDADDGHVIDHVPARGLNETVRAGPGAQALASILADTEQRVELRTDADVSINVFAQTDPERVVVHLLNFEYDPETDAMPVQQEIDLTIRDLGLDPKAAKYYSVAGISDLAIDDADPGVQVTVPRLDVWGFVVFAEREGDLDSPVDEAVASERLSEARETIDEESMTRSDFVWASAKIENAESAFEYEAYAVAHGLAEETLAIWEDRTTEGQAPGFGILAALVAIVGSIGYMLSRDKSE